MRLRKCFCLALCAVLSSLIAFSGIFGLSVSADSQYDTVTLTAAQTVALFGDSVEISYATTGEQGAISYQTEVATYYGTGQLAGSQPNYYSPVGQDLAGRTVVYYACTVPGFSLRPTEISFNFKTSVDISSVSYIDTAFLTSHYNSTIDLDNALYGTFDGYWHTSSGDHYALHRGAQGTNDYNFYGYVTRTDGFRMAVYGVCDTPNSGYSFGWASTSFLEVYDGTMYVGIVCPTLSSNWVYSGNTGAGQGGQGSSGSSSDSQDLNDVVDALNRIAESQQQDLSENGPLSWIGSRLQGLLSGILDGLRGLFVPSQEALDSFQSDMSDMLSDHLGGLYEAVDLISDQAAGLTDVSGQEYIEVPQVDIPLMSSSLRLGGESWRIPLKISDSRFSFVYTALAFIIDFLFTAAFVNMCRRKLELFLHPDAEVIDDDS